MQSHSSCQMAEQLQIFGFVTENADAKAGIGETLFDNANKFYDVLGHRGGSLGEEPTDPTDGFMHQQAAGMRIFWEGMILC